MSQDREVQRAKRVEALAQKGVRQLMMFDLALGFRTWREHYYADLWKKQSLQNVCSCFSKPQMTAAFKLWERDWLLSESAKQQMGLALGALPAPSHTRTGSPV